VIMLVGFDTEFSFRSVARIRGRLEPDVTTAVPVCACLSFEDGQEMRFSGEWPKLAAILHDPVNTIVVHGAPAELAFCRSVGIEFPEAYIDTLLFGVLLAHATAFEPIGGAYRHAALAEIAPRFQIAFTSGAYKDRIRDSIMIGGHVEEFGIEAVLDYCMEDAQACRQLAEPLCNAVDRACGPKARNILEQLYQPYARAMAETAARGIRFDENAWGHFQDLVPLYRERHLRIMRAAGYAHDGVGLSERAFGRMLHRIGLGPTWPRTPCGALRTQASDLKDRRHLHPAVEAAHRLAQLDRVLGQRLGDRIDADGRIRCGILPLAQRSSRNSTTRPNLMGIPGVLRPLLLPDEGCVFVHFDFSQQELGVAGYLSQDPALIADFVNGDVYENCGRRMGLIRDGMTPVDVKSIRNGLLKTLLLSILYGKGVAGVAKDLKCSHGEAQLHLDRLTAAYPRLFAWLQSYVCTSMTRGWSENVIGYRASFRVGDPAVRTHVERSCQNFPIQSSAAACFQVSGVHLADYGADIRLPIHDAYLLNVRNEPRAIAEAKAQIAAATDAATEQLFPGLPVKRSIEVLHRFAKDGAEDSFSNLINSLEHEREGPTCLVS